MEKKENTKLGAIYILIASLGFACMGTLVKFIGKGLPNEIIVTIRYTLSILALLPFVLLPKPKQLATKFLTNHIVRATSGILAIYCLYYAIRHIVLADAILLNNTMPLFVPFVMYFWKGERVPKKIFLPLIISFIGIIIILRPHPNIFHIGSIFALVSGILMAISTCGVRVLGKKEPFYRIIFYLFLIGFLISLIPLLWKWQLPTLLQLLILCGVAFFGFFYQYFIVLGYKVATPTKISPLIYASVIFSGLMEWLIWDVVPHLFSIIGLILVFIGAYFCMKVEHKAHPNE